MQCYCCQGEPVGQCQRCGRFYCTQHAATAFGPNFAANACVACADKDPSKRPYIMLAQTPALTTGQVFVAVAGALALCGITGAVAALLLGIR